MHHRLTKEDRKAIIKVLDIKGYDPETFDPKVLDELEANEEYKAILLRYGGDIIFSEKYLQLKEFIQHGNVTVYEHCLHVALCAIKLGRVLGVKCRERELVRGALLHDYFLYDWHVADAPGNIHPKLHGFYHPGIALRNATRDYVLSEREKDIIHKHMWPLTVKPPMCREAWIVCLADKYSSTLETLKLRKGKIRINYA
ncbi:HD domain-containing protein [Butyrivibrio sp. VCB2006]|uniref:HD domain-containing protein n=1 Tax=Butyrivibrio sp. VCB2006 TaxID=1280679 RepID=UPI000402970E|nr:HD domain-containing protein [Butyrivibrio sp. VCB2006]